jgi:hypothetical protein
MISDEKLLAIVPDTCLIESVDMYIYSNSVLSVDLEYKILDPNTPLFICALLIDLTYCQVCSKFN